MSGTGVISLDFTDTNTVETPLVRDVPRRLALRETVRALKPLPKAVIIATDTSMAIVPVEPAVVQVESIGKRRVALQWRMPVAFDGGEQEAKARRQQIRDQHYLELTPAQRREWDKPESPQRREHRTEPRKHQYDGRYYGSGTYYRRNR